MIPIRQGYDVYRVRPRRVSWKAPFFMNNDWAALRILDLTRQMGVDRPFDIVFGAPATAWSGGRPSAIRQRLSRSQAEAYFKAYADHGVKVALTFSRLEIDDADLDDPYGSMLLELAEAYGGQAIVVQDSLARRIRERHPGVALIASLDKCMTELRRDYSREVAYYHELLDLYDEVVARCEVALSDELLDGVQDAADRIELITNQVCVPNCQHCYEHISSMERLNDPAQAAQKPHDCYYLHKAKDLTWALEHSLFVSESRICELVERGFCKLKLGGRNAPMPKVMDMLGAYVFEPTGAFYQIRTTVMREYRELAERRGAPLAPFAFP